MSRQVLFGTTKSLVVRVSGTNVLPAQEKIE
jgi:hypothetical protein